MKKVLMIAFHFPPLAGSSGIQRTLRLVQHLPTMGWQPIVLSADPRAYESTSDDLLADIPAGITVCRSFTLDTARHLQVRGRYFGWMARPDRWVSWQFAAVRDGLRLIEEFKPDVIWSTFPIATAHVIASRLHRKTGIPWVADFRDPMAHVAAHVAFPADPRTWQSYLAVEADAIARARYCVFTAPGAARLYQQRYPAAVDRMVVVENGYDEESFAPLELQAFTTGGEKLRKRPFLILHSGIVYALERDPTQLFVALGRLRAKGALDPKELRIRFRASVHEDLLRSLALAHGSSEFIDFCPAIAYREALAEMMASDALLVMQSNHCNDQIPAKVYEYLRAGKPILGLTDPDGDTAGVLRQVGLNTIARLDSAEEIELALVALVHALRRGNVTLPNASIVKQYSRRRKSQALVALLEQASVKLVFA